MRHLDLDQALRARPPGHAEPTDQDRYYDNDTRDLDDPPPWLDDSEDREDEL